MANFLYPTLSVQAVYLTLASILIVVSVFALLLPLHASERSRDSAATPPRSVSPAPSSEKPRSRPPDSAVTPSNLVGILANILPVRRGAAAAVVSPPTRPGATPERYLPNTTRTAEAVAAYGRFPDYAALSGVPLPQAYKDFDISIALPRPYRPFRWAYHQTMCPSSMAPALRWCR